jgi:hypothetical protein
VIWWKPNPSAIVTSVAALSSATGSIQIPLQLQAFAVGPDGLIDWGVTTASVFAAGPASRVGAGFAATFDLAFAEVRLQAMIMKGLLVLAQFHLLNEDSGRASYFLREYYAKTHDLF